MTEQEIFDKAVTGIFSQGGFGVDANNNCSYRTPAGAKCVVGQLLSDDLLDAMAARDMRSNGFFPIMGASVRGLSRKLIDAGIAVPPDIFTHRDFLDELQRLHDGGAKNGSMGTFYSRLRKFAVFYDLDITTLNAAWDKWAYGG